MTRRLHNIITRLPALHQTLHYAVGKKSSRKGFGVELKRVSDNHYRVRVERRVREDWPRDHEFSNKQIIDIMHAVGNCFYNLNVQVTEFEMRHHWLEHKIQIDIRGTVLLKEGSDNDATN